jgi:hypothetical protein
MIYNLTQAAPKSDNVLHRGGTVQVQVTGTFGGATLNLNVSQDALAEQALSDFALTEANTLLIDMLANSVYNFEVVDASGTTDLQVSVYD